MGTDVKSSTKEVWRHGERWLVGFFGPDKPMREITPGDADRYRLHLMGTKLASMTDQKRLQFASMLFRAGFAPAADCRKPVRRCFNQGFHAEP